MNGIFVTLASVLYIAAAALILHRIIKRQPIRFAEYGIAATANIAHLCVLILSMWNSDGQDMSMTNVLSLVAWLITASMLLSVKIMPNTLLMPGVTLFSGLSVLAEALIPEHHIVRIPLSPSMITHISLSLLAYGCLCIAFLYALQMMIIRSRLKHKGKSLMQSPLPPLMLVESVLFSLTLVGSIFLFASLVTGFLFIDNMLSSQYTHKTVLSILAFCVYLLLLIGQRLWGWKNKHVVTLTSIGLTLLTLAYFGSRFVREVIL